MSLSYTMTEPAYATTPHLKVPSKDISLIKVNGKPLIDHRAVIVLHELARMKWKDIPASRRPSHAEFAADLDAKMRATFYFPKTRAEQSLLWSREKIALAEAKAAGQVERGEVRVTRARAAGLPIRSRGTQ